ncbi:MAG: DUF4886 domain-containing protein [Bacteroidaceae bacterium]|nr:DUF4886 domain-containing protein [Bacteroidaceae bacterium]
MTVTLSALCTKAQEEILSEPVRKDTIKLLTIGNSFSQDAVEQYLYELANEVGVQMIIGNAYKGGQSLEQHWTDLTQEHDVYEYRKVVNGIRTNTPHALLPPIITDEQWDFISFQQASHYSGLTTTYEPFLSQLIQYTDSIKTGQDVRYGWHMTWAYSKDSNHGGFANYGRQQEVMYDSIRYAVQWTLILHPEFSFNVPCGTAIQNARTTYLGDNMNRDGYHLDLKIGRYTAACTWLETLTGISPVGLNYKPEGVDDAAAHACQVAAHAAVQKPYEVTNLKNESFNVLNDITPTGLIKLNFGEKTEEKNWNSITPAMRTFTWITDTNNNVTGITLTNSNAFLGTNMNGATYTTTNMLMPSSVSQSCMWGYAAETFGNQKPKESCSLTLGHMNPNLRYDFTFFASRQDCQDWRETQFTLQGEKVYTDAVEASNNSNHTAFIKNVKPTPEGKIVLTIAPGRKNRSKNKFYYLNALTIKAHK